MDDDVLERAAGVLVVSACGDALGAGYEFTPAERIPADVGMIGGGTFGWEPGEWTDDTSMAWVIAEVAADGVDLRSAEAQDRIAAGWWAWASDAKDIGVQTRSVLSSASGGGTPTAESLRAASQSYHERSGRSAGNGSLMRTAPVALAYLDDPDSLVEAATRISQLTHFDPEAAEACVLHCMAIRHAVLTGEVDMTVGLPYLSDSPRNGVWIGRIEEIPRRTPDSYHNNCWTVEALMGAWSAVASVRQDDPERWVSETLEAAVRGGDDTDTVACIAGALIGAVVGESAVPDEWRSVVHGWPGRSASDLADAGRRIAAGSGDSRLDG